MVLCEAAGPFLAELSLCAFRASSAVRLGIGLDLFASCRSSGESLSWFLCGCCNTCVIARRLQRGAALPQGWEHRSCGAGDAGRAWLACGSLLGSEEEENVSKGPFPLFLS